MLIVVIFQIMMDVLKFFIFLIRLAITIFLGLIEAIGSFINFLVKGHYYKKEMKASGHWEIFPIRLVKAFRDVFLDLAHELKIIK
ncbi:MAG: hypothetical protein WAX22_02870 [Lactococcus hircilactis]|uniref:hypothetical protein n=1 Tax=Lactococcus hircilactis TaxID=1494462 RepID=UPI003BBF3F15